ncbi:MAG: hypothetical protein AB8B50_01120 [Pirellulaceae bacterium]
MAHVKQPRATINPRQWNAARAVRWQPVIYLVLFLAFGNNVSFAQSTSTPVKIWEFSPYEVALWYSIGPEVALSPAAETRLLTELQYSLKRTFRAAWKIQSSPLASQWTNIIEDRFDTFELADLSRNELVMVVSTRHPQGKSIRTIEAAAESLNSIAVTSSGFERISAQVVNSPADSETPSPETIGGQLLEKLSISEDPSSIREQLESASIPAALVPRSEAKQFGDGTRMLVATLPWQTEQILRANDKILFVKIRKQGDDYVLNARELDCPMQYVGPVFGGVTAQLDFVPRLASSLATQAFSPTARVEDASSTTAELRHRAGGLIVTPSNPARIQPGDIMQPIVRRNDRNGVPTLLQPIPFTFATITDSDGVRMDANVYTYSNGPGLQGRRNRRTQRILLRVRPATEETDVRIVVRGTETAQSGCFVYKKDLINDNFTLLGRTDWRGQFTLPVEPPPTLLRAADKRKLLLAKREASQSRAAENGSPIETPSSEPNATAEVSGEITEEVDEQPTAEPVQLNYPFLQIYVKNGDKILAKLPVVPGLQTLEIAELPDDRRRLKSEAFVRGFREEIIDIIGLRNLWAARIKLELQSKEVEKASKSLMEMRKLPTYNEMADQLELIQQQMLDETKTAITLAEKNRIDRMFQTTRDLLQKYLQDNLLRDSELAVKEAGGETGATDQSS